MLSKLYDLTFISFLPSEMDVTIIPTKEIVYAEVKL